MTNNRPIIEFIEFEKSFGDVSAIKPLNMTVNEGETFGLLGPNGGGKTTLIKALAGLHFPSKGKILVKGVDITSDPLEVRKLVSYMPQRVTLPGNLTGREVLEFFAGLNKLGKNDIDQALEFSGLEDSAERFTSEYSGGMVQRLGLAIALMRDTEILALDEPTLNLDHKGVERFRKLVQQFKERGKTILFSSHILQDAEYLADRVGIIVGGELSKIESVPEFKQNITKETKVCVILAEPIQDIDKVMTSAGGMITNRNGRKFAFKALPADRFKVIKSIEDAGGVIQEFRTDPPDWDSLIQEHFNEKEIN